MATKLSVKARQAFVQYSKKMCTAVTVFWIFYRLLVTLLIFFRVETSTAYIKLTDGVDAVMIANISVYTTNSLGEKLGLAWVKRHQKDEDEDEEKEEKKDEDDNG